MKKIDVVIVGGGITGLTAAYQLHQAQPDLTIALLEANGRLGGKVGTEYPHDFVLEWGADSMLSRKPRGLALCKQLGLADQLVGRDERHAKTFVWRYGRLHPLPTGLTGMIPTNLEALENSQLLSDEGRARLANEPQLPPRLDEADESVGAFLSRRLGPEAVENLIEPLMAGIYGGQIDQLSIEATFPHLRQLERQHGSLLGGLQQAQTAVASEYPPFVSFPKGLQTLIDALLAQSAGVSFMLDTAVTDLTAVDGGYQLAWQNKDGQTGQLAATAVLLATPAYVSSRLLASVNTDLAAALGQIPYGSSALVNLAYEETAVPPLDGYGYIVPKVEQRQALACTWTSRKWAGRAPAGKLLLRVYIGRYGEEDVTQYDDGRLLAIAQNEVQQTLGIEAAPIFSRLFRFPLAMPQYNLGHRQRVAAIKQQASQQPGLFLAGAFFNGVGIPDCIASAETAVADVQEHLKRFV